MKDEPIDKYTPMGPGFFIFFQDMFPEDGGAAYDYLIHRRKLDAYRIEAKRLIDQKKAKKLNKEKKLKKELASLQAKKMLADQHAKIGKLKEIELNLVQVSESLLKVEKDLAEIKQTREAIEAKARIMRNNDEVLILLISEGYL